MLPPEPYSTCSPSATRVALISTLEKSRAAAGAAGAARAAASKRACSGLSSDIDEVPECMVVS